MKKTSGSLICAASAGMLASCSAPAPEQPNIIFILTDDLGYGDIGPYGQRLIDTPNLDALAQNGTTFTDCYAGCAVSAPSRASLMTGLHTGHTFVRGNKEVYPEGQEPLPEETHTLGQMMKDAGYATGIFGKWGLGYPGSGSEPTDMGFDTFYGYNCQRKSHSHYPEYLWKGREKDTLHANLERARKTFAPDLIHEGAKDFIRENSSGKPFFAFLSYTLPHAELCVPQDSIWNTYRERFKDAPEDYRAWYDNGDYYTSLHPMTSFAAMVSRLDGYVGEIVELVDSLGINDNTLIIFTSDNGPHREGGAYPEFFDSNSIYRGTKRDLYEGGIRVPFIVSCPSFIPSDRTSAKPMAFWDLMPTFADIAGTDCSAQTDGLSMYDEWCGEKCPDHDFLYWEFHEEGGKQAVRMGDWKGVRLRVMTGQPRFELYNLADDPSETTELASLHPEIVAEMERIMTREHTESQIFPLLPLSL